MHTCAGPQLCSPHSCGPPDPLVTALVSALAAVVASLATVVLADSVAALVLACDAPVVTASVAPAVAASLLAPVLPVSGSPGPQAPRVRTRVRMRRRGALRGELGERGERGERCIAITLAAGPAAFKRVAAPGVDP